MRTAALHVPWPNRRRYRVALTRCKSPITYDKTTFFVISADFKQRWTYKCRQNLSGTSWDERPRDRGRGSSSSTVSIRSNSFSVRYHATEPWVSFLLASLHSYWTISIGKAWLNPQTKHSLNTCESRSIALPLARFRCLSLLGVEGFLPLPIVPIQRPRNAVDPVLAFPVQREHRGEGKAACRDGHVVAWAELRSVFPLSASGRQNMGVQSPTVLSRQNWPSSSRARRKARPCGGRWCRGE